MDVLRLEQLTWAMPWELQMAKIWGLEAKKGVEEERVEATTVSASELIEKYCAGNAVSKIQDIYPEPYKGKLIKIGQAKFDKLIGIKILCFKSQSKSTSWG